MKASNEELMQEINHIKRRVYSLEKAFDSILTKDDAHAIEEAHEDLRQGRLVSLSQVKKKHT